MDNSKVCFVTIRNIFETPCLPKYSNMLNNNFDIIYFDKFGIEERVGANKIYKFTSSYNSNKNTFKLRKLIELAKFKKYAQRLITENKYEKIIILPTQSALLLMDFLVFKYTKKYVLDIRDYASERNPFIYYMVNKLIKNSGVTSITSPAYTNFLPKHNYLISNNIQKIDEKLVYKYRNRTRKSSDKIIISFIGTIRFIDQMQNFINIFKNDTRFELHFIGTGSEKLKHFCDDNKILNVKLIGRFTQEQMAEFYMSTDLVMNVYGNNNPYLDYALSNKLYSAAIIGIPVLVSPNTYMEEITSKYGIGFSVELCDNNSPDKVHNYFQSLDFNSFYDGCDKFIDEVEKEEIIYQKNIKKFFRVDKK